MTLNLRALCSINGCDVSRVAGFVFSAVAAAGIIIAMAAPVTAGTIRVSIENIGPTGGPSLTPVFIGFHDGSYDLFDNGSAASAELERIAEDGITTPLESAFAGPGRVSRVVGGLTGPGQSASASPFEIDPTLANRYLTIASMVVPTNDFFVGNGNPLALDLLPLAGAPVGTELIFDLTRVYDAGTEVNDFSTSAANFLFPELPPGQTGPDQGADENGVVTLVDAANPYSGFLNRPDNFDPGLAGVRVKVESVPEPSSLAMIAGLGAMLVVVQVRRRRSLRRQGENPCQHQISYRQA